MWCDNFIMCLDFILAFCLQDGYVVKTTDLEGGIKVFVNISLNQHIGEASSQYTEREENGKK